MSIRKILLTAAFAMGLASPVAMAQSAGGTLDKISKAGEKFQSIVLDPPRMAGNRNQLPAALRAYHRLNLSAVNALNPDGILVTCSCSGRVSRTDFTGMLASVARRTRRPIQLLETMGADFDHPVSVGCPESEYLKCYICRVG